MIGCAIVTCSVALVTDLPGPIDLVSNRANPRYFPFESSK